MTVTEDGRPSAHTMRARFDDELMIRCPTSLGTDKVAQIRACPEIHLACGSRNSDRPGSYFRIEEREEISTGPTDRRLAWNDRLEKWFSGHSDSNHAVVRIVPYRIVALPIGGGPDARVWETQAPAGGIDGRLESPRLQTAQHPLSGGTAHLHSANPMHLHDSLLQGDR